MLKQNTWNTATNVAYNPNGLVMVNSMSITTFFFGVCVGGDAIFPYVPTAQQWGVQRIHKSELLTY